MSAAPVKFADLNRLLTKLHALHANIQSIEADVCEEVLPTRPELKKPIKSTAMLFYHCELIVDSGMQRLDRINHAATSPTPLSRWQHFLIALGVRSAS